MYENVFTPDAFIDYTCFGGPAGDPKEIRAFLEMAMPNFSSFQHMIANTVLDFVDADHVKGRTICHNPDGHGPRRGQDPRVLLRPLVRPTRSCAPPTGWRIAKRVEEKCYTHNMPAGFAVPED